MLFCIEGFDVPNWDSYVERNDSFKQEVPRYNPTVDAMKGTTIKLSHHTVLQKRWACLLHPYYPLPTTQKPCWNLRCFNSIIKVQKADTISIADCCFARVTTQWGLRIPLLQSCFARKTEDHVQDGKWPLPIWPWGCTCWHNFNLPFKQALQHFNVPVQTITCLLASKNEFHNFTSYGLQTKITSPHIIHLGKGLPGIQSIPSQIRVFQMQANKNHISRILYINWNLNRDSLAPSISTIEITIASVEFLGCSTCSINQIEVWWALIKGLFKHLKLVYVDGN